MLQSRQIDIEVFNEDVLVKNNQIVKVKGRNTPVDSIESS